MSAWMEKNTTEYYEKVAKALGEFYDDRLLTFSPEHIINIENDVDWWIKNFQNPPAIYVPQATVYYGEIIRRAIGGEWISINDFGENCLSYIRYGSFLIHPSSEIVWMVEYGWKNHLQKFYKNVIKEITNLKEIYQKGSSIAEMKIFFNCIFPDRYLNYIAKYRDYERQENNKNLVYLGLSVSELNKAHMK